MDLLFVRLIAPVVIAGVVVLSLVSLFPTSGRPVAVARPEPPAPRVHPAAALAVPTGAPSDPAVSAVAEPPAGSVYVATATVPSLPVYATPRALAAEQAITNPNPLGAPLTLLVNQVAGGWLQVYLPERPNESTGWVSATNVSLATDAYHVVVSLGARQVTLYRGGVKVVTDSAAVGEPTSPTPTGHFFVTEDLQLTDPGGRLRSLRARAVGLLQHLLLVRGGTRVRSPSTAPTSPGSSAAMPATAASVSATPTSRPSCNRSRPELRSTS